MTSQGRARDPNPEGAEMKYKLTILIAATVLTAGAILSLDAQA